MKYAVVQTGGKQYKVQEGAIIEVDKLPVEAGQSVTFDTVYFYAADGAFKLGQPTVDGAVVTGKVLEQTQGEKIRVTQFKAKARHRRVKGFRAQLTKVQIEKIEAKAAKKAEK